MYVHALLSSLLTCSSFDSSVCKFSVHIYQTKGSLYYKTKLVLALPAIAGLKGHHLILGMSLYYFWPVSNIVIAVILILKHATFLRLSEESELALTHAELNYQEANINLTVQQYLEASSPKLTVKKSADFIMATEFGLLIPLLVTIISHQTLRNTSVTNN